MTGNENITSAYGNCIHTFLGEVLFQFVKDSYFFYSDILIQNFWITFYMCLTKCSELCCVNFELV